MAKGQDTRGLAVKNFSPAFGALEDYDVSKLYVEKESLAVRGLAEADLMVPVQVVDAAEMARLMAEQDVVMSF